jgi:hypothetical protein
VNAETVSRTIQLILAPVVMVSACSILVGGLQAHYMAINDRLRAMARERLDLLRSLDRAPASGAAEADRFALERLEEIDHQIPDLLCRHREVHDAVLAVYCAILIFVASMFVIACAAVVNADWAATAALLVFLGGVAALLVGVLLIAIAVRTSHRSLQYEVGRIEDLGK